MAGALLVPDDAVVYPPAVATHLLASSPAVQIVRGQFVTAAGRNSVTLSDGTVLRAGWVILATGSDCSLLPTLPIQKRKGHLLITDRYPGFVRHQLVELGYLKSAHKLAGDSVAFNIQPRQTGQMLIGSSRQYGTGDPSIEPHMLRQMLDRAVSYLPALAQLSGIRAWAGFRAATPDKLPLVGSSEAFGGDASLQLAMGFEGLGITNCLGAAELLVDSLLGRPSAIDRSPYDPARFASSLSAEAIHA
jgi:glycine/D-amino acid oxidase-like deaminating enzyme